MWYIFDPMNFLSHYYFDRIKGNSYYNLGLLLPDLLRNFGSALHHLQDDKISFSEGNFLASGFHQHIATDKIFHTTKGFVSLNKHLTERLRKSEADFNRDWFLAHILTELLLDRAILFKNPAIARQLYAELEGVDYALLKKFFSEINYPAADSFLYGFDRFMKVRYLQSYTEPESIAYAMGRIAQKMNIHISDERHKSELMIITLEFTRKIHNFMEDLEAIFLKNQN